MGRVRRAREEEIATPRELVKNALGGVPPDEPRMETYSHGNYALFFVGSLWSIGLLAVIVITGFGGWLQRQIERWTRRPNLKAALLVAVHLLIVFVIEGRYRRQRRARVERGASFDRP